MREIIAAAAVVILAMLLVDPLNLWMPSGIQMTLLIFLILAFTFFAIFVWGEKGRDEREEKHIMQAGRMAFLSGASIITIGIIYQSFQHNLDLWLVIALVVMVVAKIAGLISAQLRN